MPTEQNLVSTRQSLFPLQPLSWVSLLLLFWSVAYGQLLSSPCPEILSYLVDQRTNQWFGYVELQNLRIGQLVNLNIDLSFGGIVSQDNAGSITLVKSREQTFHDIYNKQPAQYRVHFPRNSVIPNVLAISVNGHTICTGRKATGPIVTPVNLEHTLFTQPLSIGTRSNGQGFQSPLVRKAPQRQQSQLLRQTRKPPTQNKPKITPRVSHSNNQIDALAGIDEECGVPASGFNKLSINGIRSAKGQFPWAVPVFAIGYVSKPKYICGSTIISKCHLLTAAHCMYNGYQKRQVTSLLTAPGMYNIDNFLEPNIQMRHVVSYVTHPDYFIEHAESSGYDIAILRLAQVISYNNQVKPICLWSGSDNLEEIVGMSGLVSGWGITEEGWVKYPSYVDATVLDKSTCLTNLGTIINDAPTFCADGHGAVPCSGDSGSGLVIKRGRKYYIRGIVSVGQFDFSRMTCDRYRYIVYTDIAPFRYWMSKVLRA